MNLYIILGDPSRDMEYEEAYGQQSQSKRSYIVSEPIRQFLKYFQKVIKDQNTYEIQNAYESG